MYMYVMRPRNNGFRPAVVVDAVILTLRSKTHALLIRMPRNLDADDDDLSDGGQRSSLLNDGGRGTDDTKLSQARWPWVLLGVFIGLLAVLFVPANSSSSIAAQPGAGGATACEILVGGGG